MNVKQLIIIEEEIMTCKRDKDGYYICSCLDCETEMKLKTDNLELGDVVECDECGAEMEVLKKDPDLELELIEEEK